MSEQTVRVPSEISCRSMPEVVLPPKDWLLSEPQPDIVRPSARAAPPASTRIRLVVMPRPLVGSVGGDHDPDVSNPYQPEVDQLLEWVGDLAAAEGREPSASARQAVVPDAVDAADDRGRVVILEHRDDVVAVESGPRREQDVEEAVMLE